MRPEEQRMSNANMSAAAKSLMFRKAADEYFKAEKFNAAPNAALPEVKYSDVPGGTLSVVTNFFELEPSNDGLELYFYNIQMVGAGVREVTYSAVGPNDMETVTNRKVCELVFAGLRQHNIIPNNSAYYYDNCNYLFSTVAFDPNLNASLELQRIPCDETEIPMLRYKSRGVDYFRMNIVSSQKFNILQTKEFSEACELGSDATFVHFLETVVAQAAIKRPDDFVSYNNGRYYATHEKVFAQIAKNDLGDGQVTQMGMSIMGKISRDPAEKYSRSLVAVEPKISPFHTAVAVHKKFEHMLDALARGDCNAIAHVEEVMRGVIFLNMTVATEKNRFFAHKFLRLAKPANSQKFTLEEKDREPREVTVKDYVHDRYSVDLKYPNLPVVVAKRRGEGLLYFPMESCLVYDDQRVKHQTQGLITQLIKVSAVLPRELLTRVEMCSEALQLRTYTGQIETAKMHCQGGPVNILARKMILPQVFYRGKRSMSYNTQRFNWPNQGAQFVTVQPIERWAIYGVQTRSKRITDRDLAQFRTAYIAACNNRGMNMPEPLEVGIFASVGGSSALDQLFKRAEAIAGECQFMLVVTDLEDKPIHSSLKGIERRFEIITQNVTIQVASRPDRRITMDNIASKTNVKLGGLNYNVDLPSDDLFIGLAINRPGMESAAVEGVRPTIVGYSVNMGAPLNFVGDFVYEKTPYDSPLIAMKKALADIFEQYKQHRGGDVSPRHIILYRSGCSVGWMEEVLRYEVSLVKGLMTKHFGDVAKLVFIVVSKRHPTRLFPANADAGSNDAKTQNLPPGLVIDRAVTSATVPEFYLTTHIALKGTAKFPCYSIVCNDSGLTYDAIEEFSLRLSFGLQIINSPVSVPAPLFIAEEFAKRGRMLLNADTVKDLIPSENPEESVRQMNKALSMGKMLFLFVWAMMALLMLTGCEGRSVMDGTKQKQNPDELRRLYAALQRQIDEDEELSRPVEARPVVRLGTVKTRRAPSVEGFEWEGMMQALDNLQKPRFG